VARARSAVSGRSRCWRAVRQARVASAAAPSYELRFPGVFAGDLRRRASSPLPIPPAARALRAPSAGSAGTCSLTRAPAASTAGAARSNLPAPAPPRAKGQQSSPPPDRFTTSRENFKAAVSGHRLLPSRCRKTCLTRRRCWKASGIPPRIIQRQKRSPNATTPDWSSTAAWCGYANGG